MKAAAICSMLNDWSGMDVEKSVAYILSCQVLCYIQCVGLILPSLSLISLSIIDGTYSVAFASAPFVEFAFK